MHEWRRIDVAVAVVGSVTVSVGDKITVVAYSGQSTICAQVSLLFDPDKWAGFRWVTDWQAEGVCLLRNEGVTWVHGYVDEAAQNALISAYWLAPGVQLDVG